MKRYHAHDPSPQWLAMVARYRRGDHPPRPGPPGQPPVPNGAQRKNFNLNLWTDEP